MPDVILVLDRGIVELAVPRGWPVLPQPSGSIKIIDPKEDCSLEVSFLRTPGLTKAPPIAEFLAMLLADTPDAAAREPVEETTRGPMRCAWCTYPFMSLDTGKRERRRAFGRWLLASRGEFHALLTCYWWEDDAPWAAPAVNRACESLFLGDGVPLASPADHWAMRERN